jgi:cellulose synthase (UDP-forming)
MAMSWLDKGARMPLLFDAQGLVTTFAVIPATLRVLRNPKNHAFTITAKGAVRGRYVIHWNVFGPLLGVSLALGGSMLFSLTPYSPVRGLGSWAWIYYFSIYRLIVLYLACNVAVERPKSRHCERFSTGLKVTARRVDRRLELRALDVSERGLLVDAPVPLSLDEHLVVEVETLGAYDARVVRRAGGSQYGLELLHGTEASHHQLIRAIYCDGAFVLPQRSWPFWQSMKPLLKSFAGR